MPKIGPFEADLAGLPASNDAGPWRERPTPIRVFEERRGRGYDGGDGAVRRCAGAWKRDRVARVAAADARLSFAPGEAHRFDWWQRGSDMDPVDRCPDEQSVLINGTTTTVKVAHATSAAPNQGGRLRRAAVCQSKQWPEGHPI